MSALPTVVNGFIAGAVGGICVSGLWKRRREDKRDAACRMAGVALAGGARAGTAGLSRVQIADIGDCEAVEGQAGGAGQESEGDDSAAEAADTGSGDLEALRSRLAEWESRVEALEVSLESAQRAALPLRDEAALALAEYRRQLDEAGFNPEGDGVTAAMLAEYRAAWDAAERAQSAAARKGKTRDKEIYAAIGQGRKALIRLTAMRAHQPVPITLLTDEELSGFVNASTDVHTEDRFRWEGKGPAEFLLDRPEFGKPVLLEVTRVDGPGRVDIVQVERTDRRLAEMRNVTLSGKGEVFRDLIVPKVTHLSITGSGSWRARIVQFDELPPTTEAFTGRGEAMFHHTMGSRTVTMQGTRGGLIKFVRACNCTGVCTKGGEHSTFDHIARFSGDFREDVDLPWWPGVLYMDMYAGSIWSVAPAAKH